MEVALEEYFLQLRGFKVEIACVGQKEAYSSQLKKHMYVSKENHLCYKQEHQAHCFTFRIELVFQEMHPTTWLFQSGDRLFLLQFGLYSFTEETQVSRPRTPSVLEASNTLLPCGN
jgi:hypothetical protein